MSTEMMTDDAVQALQQHAQDPGNPEMLQQTLLPSLVVEQSQLQTPQQQPAPSTVVVPQLDHSVAPMVQLPTQATQLTPSLLVGALQPQLPPQPLMVTVHDPLQAAALAAQLAVVSASPTPSAAAATTTTTTSVTLGDRETVVDEDLRGRTDYV